MTIKLMVFGRRRLGQTLSEHRAHMKDVHGQLVLKYIAEDPEHAPRRYVQNHAFDGVYWGQPGHPAAFAAGLDFVTEVWFPDLAALKSSRETAFYFEHLQPDEPQMVDDPTVVGVPFTEEVVHAPATAGQDRVKVFLVWHGDVPAPAVLTGLTGSAGEQPLGHTRSTPAVPSPVQAVDQFWFRGETEALAFAQTCRDAVLSQLPADTQTFTITIAREYVLHAG
ncbi:EthD domain-containing protein [Roseibium litorale]|uniref:EthD domain-containing protein n=1 Tax=Roseibium litorale TaxID=2803841 RepID=A0ABR9CRQ5_9HYPH|nr:EthD domain-containing protein [Roseibium litorale]MBD8893304.1 EthD domain-containing protein [Roseibium litorale]